MPNPEKMRIALVQMRCGQEPETNLARALELIHDAAESGAEIVCLPELFRSQYFCQSENQDNLSLAEIILYPTAIGWHPSEKKEFGKAQHSAWETIQRSHAIANGCYIAVANRIGHEAPAGGDGIEFWGQSFLCGPDGEIIAKGSFDREEIVMAEIDWSAVSRHRTHWPFLRDRRVDAYAGIQQRLID